MTPLKERTVYIPIDISEVSEKTFITMSKVRGQIHLKQDKLICISKEQLIELLGKAWDASNDRRLYESLKEKGISPFVHHHSKEDFINNILNQ